MFNIYYIKLLNDAESFQGKVYIFFSFLYVNDI